MGSGLWQAGHTPTQALWLQLVTQTAAVSPQRGFLPDGSWSMRSCHLGRPGPQRAQREPERLVPAEVELGAAEGGQVAHSTTVGGRTGACLTTGALSYWVKCVSGPLSPRFCLKRC